MKNNPVILSIIAAVILFGGLYGVYMILGGGPDEALIQKIKVDRPAERTMWNPKAQHTLAVFSDHQCPACKIFHEYLAAFEDVKNANNAVTKKSSFVFHYFPLYQIHEQAFPLAYAAEAAARQGKFEEITKRFFADQTQFTTMKNLDAYLVGVAKDLGLDVKKFTADRNDKTLQAIIQNDLSLGESLGVNSTPTFFLDGEKLDSVAPADLLKILKDLK